MGGAHGRRLPKAHETILWFKKSDAFKINEESPEVRVPYSDYVRDTMQQDSEATMVLYKAENEPQSY